MGFQVHAAASKSASTTKAIYGGSEDKDTAIALAKEACARRLHGPKTIAFVTRVEDPGHFSGMQMVPSEGAEVLFETSAAQEPAVADFELAQKIAVEEAKLAELKGRLGKSVIGS